MKTLEITLTALLLAAFLFFACRVKAQEPKITVPPLSVPLDNVKLVAAIRLTEAWDGHSEGRAGERGPSQIKLITWKQHTKAPWAHAVYHTAGDRIEYREVELAHAAWIRDVLESKRHPMPQTAYQFALIWRAGYRNVLKGNVTAQEIDYAERCANCYRELIK